MVDLTLTSKFKIFHFNYLFHKKIKRKKTTEREILSQKKNYRLNILNNYGKRNNLHLPQLSN